MVFWAVALFVLFVSAQTQNSQGKPTSGRPSNVLETDDWDVWETDVRGGLPPLDKVDEDTGPVSPKIASNTSPYPTSELTSGAPARFPNPCTDSDFRTPVFKFSDWNITRTYLNATSNIPLLFHASTSVRDTVNNISMKCVAREPLRVPLWQSWIVDCTTVDGAQDDRYTSLVSISIYTWALEPVEPGRNRDGNLGISQYWYCAQDTREQAYP